MVNTNSIEFWGFIVSVIALSASLWFNILASKRNKNSLFNDLVRGFFQVNNELHTHKKSQSEKIWDSYLFNNIEYISYIANRDKYICKKVLDFLGEAFLDYKEGILLINHKEDYEDNTKYEEWKKLCEKVKKKMM